VRSFILSSRYAEFREQQGCARIFWSTTFVELEGKEFALEYFSSLVGKQNSGNKGVLEYFGQVGT
jgi:hypothetical protein